MPPFEHIDQFVHQWTLDGRRPIGSSENSDESFENILSQIKFMASEAYEGYVPGGGTRHAEAFSDRVVDWLQNEGLQTKDQIALFQLILRLAYFSPEDYKILWRIAFNRNISRWIWDDLGLNLDTPSFQSEIGTELRERTWFIGATDSMKIDDFCHANALAGCPSRPDVGTMRTLGDPGRVREQSEQFNRVVILEDNVGSGTQSEPLIRWFTEIVDKPTLFVPILMGPDAQNRLRPLTEQNEQLSLSPIMELGPSTYLSPPSEDVLNEVVTEIAERTFAKVLGNATPGQGENHLGFSRPNDSVKGALVVLYSNTPNNTLPLIHFDSNKSDWSPLFPRVSRH